MIIQSVGLTGDPALLLAGGTMDTDATITLSTSSSDSVTLSGSGATFDNGSSVSKGTTDAGLNGNNGVALKCSLSYELKWDAGRLFTMGQDGFSIRRVDHCGTTAPTTTDDSTKGFVVGSIWTLDNGISYICAGNTANNAVWNPYSPEFGVDVWPSGNPEPVSQNVVALQIQASGAVTEGEPIPNDISVIITFAGVGGPCSYTLELTEGTVFNSTTIAASLASGLSNAIQALPATQYNNVSSYDNFVSVDIGAGNFNDLSSITLTCNYGTASAPANRDAGGVIQYCTFIPLAVGQFIIEAYGSRQWECSNVSPIIWTEITKEAPVTVSSSTDILTVGASNNLTFSLDFGDGINFDNPTNTISCNTNIARRAGNQTFTGNNNYGTSIAPVTTTFFGTQTFNGSRTLAGTSTFSGQVELTGQSATNTTSALTRALGDARYGSTQNIALTTFTSVSNVLSPSLSITLNVGVYQFDAFIASIHDSVAGCQIRLGTTHNIKVALTDNYGRPAVAAFSEAIIADDYSNANLLATRSDTGGTAYRRTITGIIEVLTNGTSITLDYAQAVTTPASPSTARIRRYLIVRKLN